MARPTVSPSAESLYTVLSPLAYADEQNDWALLKYCEALAGSLQEVANYVLGTNGYPNWSSVLDIDRCPDEALPWLGQFVGVEVPPQLEGETDEVYYDRIREYIRATPGFSRGTPDAMIAAIKQTLTGTKTVYLRERSGGNAYQLEVFTYQSETPNPSYTLAAIIAQKPAGIVLTHTVAIGQDYQILFQNNATYQTVFTKYPSYQGMFLDKPV